MIDARLSVGLPAHPKTKKLIRRIGTDGAWRLVCLFLWAASNKPDGDLSGMSTEDVELAVDWAGPKGLFVSALEDSGFISRNGHWLVLDMEQAIPSKPIIPVVGRVCSKVWRRIRISIFNRDGMKCVYCGNDVGPFECDHIVPVSRGGSNDRSNLATACVKCNRSKRAKLVEEWVRGVAV